MIASRPVDLGTAIILLAGDHTALGEKVLKERTRLQGALGDQATVVVAAIVEEPPELNSSWKFAIEIRSESGNLSKVVEGLAHRLGEAVDATGSAVAVGSDLVVYEHPIASDQHPVTLYYALFRRPDIARVDFADHWSQIHPRFVKENGYPLTYRQLHCDEDATRDACEAAGFGVHDVAGVAHEQFLDQETFVAATVDPNVAEEVADVATFSDMARSGGLLTRVLP